MNQPAPQDWKSALDGDGNAATVIWTALGQKSDFTAQSVDVDQGWNSLQSKLDAAIPGAQALGPAKNIRIRRLYVWVAAAAAAVLALVLVNYLSGLQDTQQDFVNQGTSPMSISLPDKSTVALAPGSRLHFSQEDKFRQVQLEGSASFQVKSDPDLPFQVKDKSLEVVVVGTQFSIKRGSTSIIEVTEGHVRARGNREVDWVDLFAGSSAEAVDGEILQASIVTSSPDDLNYQNAEVGRILKDLERFHSTEIEASSDLFECRITATFSGSTLPDALKTISLLLGAEVKTQGKSYQLIGGSCR